VHGAAAASLPVPHADKQSSYRLLAPEFGAKGERRKLTQASHPLSLHPRADDVRACVRVGRRGGGFPSITHSYFCLLLAVGLLPAKQAKSQPAVCTLALAPCVCFDHVCGAPREAREPVKQTNKYENRLERANVRALCIFLCGVPVPIKEGECGERGKGKREEMKAQSIGAWRAWHMRSFICVRVCVCGAQRGNAPSSGTVLRRKRVQWSPSVSPPHPPPAVLRGTTGKQAGHTYTHTHTPHHQIHH
jgi:hypothetical protein